MFFLKKATIRSLKEFRKETGITARAQIEEALQNYWEKHEEDNEYYYGKNG